MLSYLLECGDVTYILPFLIYCLKEEVLSLRGLALFVCEEDQTMRLHR